MAGVLRASDTRVPRPTAGVSQGRRRGGATSGGWAEEDQCCTAAIVQAEASMLCIIIEWSASAREG